MRILVIDHNLDGLDLLARTLARKFPKARIIQTTDADHGHAADPKENFDAIVVHRAVGLTGEDTVRVLRQLRPTVPIIMVSGTDKAQEAQQAGATAFLLYDSWLMLGGVVADALNYDSGHPWKSRGSESSSTSSEGSR